jgi:hypothetical protein
VFCSVSDRKVYSSVSKYCTLNQLDSELEALRNVKDVSVNLADRVSGDKCLNDNWTRQPERAVPEMCMCTRD